MAAPRPVVDEETPTRFANFALGLDAAFCNIVGLIFTLTGAFMADWLGVPGWLATLFGVLVLMWSFVVTLFANRKVSRRREVDVTMWFNVAFVIVAVIVLAIPGAMSTNGKILLGIGTAIVASFAIAQAYARRDLA